MSHVVYFSSIFTQIAQIQRAWVGCLKGPWVGQHSTARRRVLITL